LRKARKYNFKTAEVVFTKLNETIDDIYSVLRNIDANNFVSPMNLDGVTIQNITITTDISGTNTISGYLPITGGTMLGVINHISSQDFNGTDANLTGDLDVDLTANVDGTLTVGGITTLNNPLDLNSSADIQTTLTVGGITTLNDNLDLNGAADISGNLDVGGDATISGTAKIGDGGTTNYAEFEVDGTLKFNGTATVWNDYVSPLGPNNWNGVSNNPTLTKLYDDGSGSQGVYAYVFSDGDEALVTVQMPHGWKIGSTIYPHIHFVCLTDVDPTDNFGIEFEYSWVDVNEDFAANSTLSSIEIETGVDTDNMHQVADITAAGIDGSGHTLSSVLLCRIKRVAAVGDNYAGGIAILDFDIHCEIDTIGSRQEYVK